MGQILVAFSEYLNFMWSICSCTIYVLSDFVYQNWTYVPYRRTVLISLVLIDKNKSWFTVRTGCLQLNQTAAAEVGEKTEKLRFTLTVGIR